MQGIERSAEENRANRISALASPTAIALSLFEEMNIGFFHVTVAASALVGYDGALPRVP